MGKSLVVLAYSGGLDTSCILKWLIEKDYDVVCYMADVGQDEDFDAARKKALKIGAKEAVVDDRRCDFVENYMIPAISSGLIYESRYLLGTSLARPCISRGLVDAAKRFKAKYIAHGATGKGNDQVRFELGVYALWPEAKVIAPWREREFFERFPGRLHLIEYARERGIPVPATKAEPWSVDANIMHTSYESGILENPSNVAPIELYKMTVDPQRTPDSPLVLQIEFREGKPTLLEFKKEKHSDPLDIVKALNQIGRDYGIGRIDIVENRFVGLKSRGIYESPGATILYEAHLDLEALCLDREVLRVKKYLQDRLSEMVYNGFWFSPEANYIRKCLDLSRVDVNGSVTLSLFKGNVSVLARSSDESLYNEDLVSMDRDGGFDPSHATGFINVHAIRLKEYSRYVQRKSQSKQ